MPSLPFFWKPLSQEGSLTILGCQHPVPKPKKTLLVLTGEASNAGFGVNTILPWHAIMLLCLTIMLVFKVLLDGVPCYLARCASMEIAMGQRSEVLNARHPPRQNTVSGIF